jgi:lysophospholipase L1-like esterase
MSPPAAPDDRPSWIAPGSLRPFTSLRPWLAALVLLFVLDLTLRATLPPDPRVLRRPLAAQACMADDALDALVDRRALGDVRDSAGPPLDVILLGDSVLGSVNNPPGQRLGDFLLRHLEHRGVHARIHNLSAGGAHAADQYGALLRLYRRLSQQPSGLHNVVVVLSVNPIFFSRRHSQPAALFPCLFAELADDDLGGPDAADTLRRRLGVPRPPPALEHRLAQILARTWYQYQQRRRGGEALLAGHDALLAALRGTRSTPAAADRSTDAANRPWFAQGLVAKQYASSYDLLAFDDPQAVNAQQTAALAAWLARHRDVQVLVEGVPQNHFLMGEYTARPAYQTWAQQVAALFRAAGLTYHSHDRDPSLRSEHFQDLDHLTAPGNDTLAAWIAADLAGLLRREGAANPTRATPARPALP